MKGLLPFFLLLVLISCSKKKEETKKPPLFYLKSSSETGISFENKLNYSETFNPYLYRNFYNGGGVAIGDINNDGLEDIYFTGNMVDNKLYLNKGDWKFEEISVKSGVNCPEVWSTGATFADVNNDGYLDLYVCKSGKPEGENRHNELFINNGDLTFTESSKKYGLDVKGLSVHAAFFDYDKDGDLDAYILNNSLKSIGGFDLIQDQRSIPDEQGNGNKFFRNDNGTFKDVTIEAGIYSSAIGFGLGITLGDFNNDDYTDIFVSNDFFERDYLYINQGNGKFIEKLESYFNSISMGSMGADVADLNNDLLPDLIVTEMLPETDERKKTKTVFESWDKHDLAVKRGYFYQYSRNVLQRNLGSTTFSEIGRQSQVSATEWSWAALLFDMDNDGLRDIFISNGIFKDLLDRDYLNFEANDETVRAKLQSKEKNVITKLIDGMPSKAVVNGVFQNIGNFQFEKKSTDWGLDEPSFSNGSAYADLDNDGDLDLILNNVNMPSFIYENRTDTLNKRSIQFKLNQDKGNVDAIGAKITIAYGDGLKAVAENYVSRGFQSSVTSKIHFGVGNATAIDTLTVQWPDGTVDKYHQLQTNQVHHLKHLNPSKPKSTSTNTLGEAFLSEKNEPFSFLHKENQFTDFNNERLLPQCYSNEGPAIAINDINADGLPDYFMGGAKGQSGSLFISSSSGYTTVNEVFQKDKNSEDTDAVFFDGDNDGDYDLYVAHGGRAFSSYSTDLNDSYYENIDGHFQKSESALSFPKSISSSVVKATDFDQDGDIDLFVGERYQTNTYGLPGAGYLMINNGKGQFKLEQTLLDVGMITDAVWIDLNNDNLEDLVVVGEWMPIKVFLNENGKLRQTTKEIGLEDTNGLWTAIHHVDLDGDGDNDLVVGNIGLNNYMKPDMRIFVHDFDQNGFKEQIICSKKNGKYYPIVDKDELISQIPPLKKKLLYYKDYANATMESLFDTTILNSAYYQDIHLLESIVLLNENGKFQKIALPSEIQYSPVYAITSRDTDLDGKPDLFFGGNQYIVKPQFGRYDASFGWGIMGVDDLTKMNVFSLGIPGQIRVLNWVDFNNEQILIATRNNDSTKFYKTNTDN
ncbi:MAG: hypothetical protein CML04_06400 [Pseudozobellia sp.]|nr:hypothetical protein [Pseudozobellia sp.]|tara:strand:+ start:6457 stop:9726 length:3270 start_codon:yes stop_codon:yes gene_type:complete